MKILQLKKLKIGALFLMLIVFTITSISCEKPRHEQEDEITQDDIDAMKKDHIISLKEAVKMYDKYSKERVKILKDTLKKKYGDGFSDTRNVWVDITTLRAYLQHIDDESAKIGVNPEGLAFYFSVDTENQGAKNNYQTFFVAPTEKNGKHQSGYTIVDGEKKYVHDAIKQHLESTNLNLQKGSFFSLLQDGKGLLLNDMVPNPPGGTN